MPDVLKTVYAVYVFRIFDCREMSVNEVYYIFRISGCSSIKSNFSYPLSKQGNCREFVKLNLRLFKKGRKLLRWHLRYILCV